MPKYSTKPLYVPKPVLTRKASPVEEVEWVAKHIEAKVTQKTIDRAPSPQAAGMLLSYYVDRKRKDEFWDNVYKQLMPGKAQLAASTSSTEKVDGEAVIAHIDEILAIGQSKKTKVMRESKVRDRELLDVKLAENNIGNKYKEKVKTE